MNEKSISTTFELVSVVEKFQKCFCFSVIKRINFRIGLMIWDHCDTAVFSKKAKFLRRFYDLHTAVPVLINNIP